MIKHIMSGVAVLFLTLLALSCKNTSPADTKTPEISYPFEKPDSLFGFEGCNMAGFKAISKTERQFFYQNFIVKVKDKEEEPGEIIEVYRDTSGPAIQVPASLEAGYFMGASRDHFFADLGTGPDLRQVVIYKLQDDGLMQVYQADYLPGAPPFVSSNGAFWFYAPIEESKMLKMPDCPDKEKWLKDGLRVGYGQRCIYNMVNRMLTLKSEYVCVPLQ